MTRLILNRIPADLLAIGLCLLPLQQASAQAILSADDYIAIQQLVNKFNFTLDYCTNGGQDFADLFTEDGEYIIDQGNGNPTIRTHDQLSALAGGPSCDSRRTAPSS